MFARGFRKEVHVPRDLAAQTERLLERAALDALAIAGKAGAIVGGFAKVEAALGRDDVLALIHAADAADNGKRKLAAALQRNTGGKPGEIAIIDTFTGAQLDLALSRPNVVHAALLAGPGSETFLARVARLTRFRTGFLPDAVSAHAPTEWRIRTQYGMSETKNPGEKKLSVSGKTLTLKPRSETGTVRQSFSHGRSKQVVVEKVKRRVVGGETKAEAPPAAESKKPAGKATAAPAAGRAAAQAETAPKPKLQASYSAR